MKLRSDYALSYDDVTLRPQYSEINSRSDIDLSVSFLGMTLRHPIIASPMDSVLSPTFIDEFYRLGGFCWMDRFTPIEEQKRIIRHLRDSYGYAGASIGVNTTLQQIQELIDCGASSMLVDVAHGSCSKMRELLLELEKSKPAASLVIGNFATNESMNPFRNFEHIVGAYRVGIAQGSMCTTALATGHGIPMISSVAECSFECDRPIIADGGVRHAGDIAKAIGAGATMVMLGRLFSQTRESAQQASGKREYRGSASISCKRSTKYVEGESMEVPVLYTLEELLTTLTDGLRSALSYTGARNLTEFREKASFSKVTYNGYVQTLAHGKYNV